ncbi:MAG: ABC transporter permease, partial [Bacteroidetes bacterium]|nr:ABC transporter permease [Bacteroidota bacterium]
NRLRNLNEVESLSMVLEENALLKYRDNQYIATIKGVDNEYTAVTGLDNTLIDGEYSLKGMGVNRAVLGAGIEAYLSIILADQSTPVTVFMPKRGNKFSLSPDQAFNIGRIYPAGVFAIQQEFDVKYMIVPLDFARKLLDYENEIGAIEIKLKPETSTDDVKVQIKEILGPGFNVKDRYEQNEFLYKIMKSEKWAMFAILTLVLLITAFNIVGSLSMLVIEKKLDIAILKTMGASNAMIRKIFLFEGLLMSAVGSFIGLILGVAICKAQQVFELVELQGSGTFVISAYPVKMEIMDFILVLLVTVCISVFAAWLPARRAASEQMVFKEE